MAPGTGSGTPPADGSGMAEGARAGQCLGDLRERYRYAERKEDATGCEDD